MPVGPACSGAAFLPWLSGASYCTLRVARSGVLGLEGGRISGILESGEFSNGVRGPERLSWIRDPSELLLDEALPGAWHDWDQLDIELCCVGLGTFEGTRGITWWLQRCP